LDLDFLTTDDDLLLLDHSLLYLSGTAWRYPYQFVGGINQEIKGLSVSTLDEMKSDEPSLLSRLWEYFVNLVALFVTAVLSHPDVEEAAARLIVRGINDTCEQPDLGEKVSKVSKSLRLENEAISRQLGEQFPKMASNFVGGAVAGLRGKASKRKSKNSDDESDVTSSNIYLENNKSKSK
jgi:hypothetical protein